MNPDLDIYFNRNEKQQDGMEQLRSIVLDCGLKKELKRGLKVDHKLLTEKP